MREIAESLYHGKDKLNCAQAILKAFQDKYSVEQSKIDEFKAFGGGRAEGNVCGALYAAFALEKNDELHADMTEQFVSHAKSVKCLEIRGNKTLPCKSCVGVTADILAAL